MTEWMIFFFFFKLDSSFESLISQTIFNTGFSIIGNLGNMRCSLHNTAINVTRINNHLKTRLAQH